MAVLFVTKNGTLVSGPVFIYHDELMEFFTLADNSTSDALVCHSTSNQTSLWHLENGEYVRRFQVGGADHGYLPGGPVTDVIQILHTPGMSRLMSRHDDRARNSELANGLITCRLDGAEEGAIPVGLYHRERGIIIIKRHL
jgi:hypothetical protein